MVDSVVDSFSYVMSFVVIYRRCDCQPADGTGSTGPAVPISTDDGSVIG